MFYVEGWVPLVEVIDHVAEALQKRYSAEKRKAEVGSGAFYDDVYAQVWKLCDKSTAGIISPGCGLILLSTKLFTRNSETSQYGDFLCLTIGQLGSGYWRPWIEDPEPDALARDDIDPTPFVQPYLNCHVMIRADEKLTKILEEIAKPEVTGSRKPGRPNKKDEFRDAYRKAFSDGHAGFTKQQAIDEAHKRGAPNVSISTFDRMIRDIKPTV